MIMILCVVESKNSDFVLFLLLHLRLFRVPCPSARLLFTNKIHLECGSLHIILANGIEYGLNREGKEENRRAHQRKHDHPGRNYIAFAFPFAARKQKSYYNIIYTITITII